MNRKWVMTSSWVGQVKCQIASERLRRSDRRLQSFAALTDDPCDETDNDDNKKNRHPYSAVTTNPPTSTHPATASGSTVHHVSALRQIDSNVQQCNGTHSQSRQGLHKCSPSKLDKSIYTGTPPVSVRQHTVEVEQKLTRWLISKKSAPTPGLTMTDGIG
jgi:hypothetical protein